MDKEKELTSEFVEEILDKFLNKEKINDEDIDMLVAGLYYSRVIFRYKPVSNRIDGMRIDPECVVNPSKDKFLAVYTSTKQIKEQDCSTISIMFNDLCNESLLKTESLKGIIINPFTKPLEVNKQLIELIIMYKNFVENKNKKH